MPGTASEVNADVRAYEGAQGLLCRIGFGWRDNNEIAAFVNRHEELASQGMALHQLNCFILPSRIGEIEVNGGSTAVFGNVNVGEVSKFLSGISVDRYGRPRGLDNVAERGERGAAQRFCFQFNQTPASQKREND